MRCTPPPRCSGGQRSGRYASYWYTFLLQIANELINNFVYLTRQWDRLVSLGLWEEEAFLLFCTWASDLYFHLLICIPEMQIKILESWKWNTQFKRSVLHEYYQSASCCFAQKIQEFWECLNKFSATASPLVCPCPCLHLNFCKTFDLLFRLRKIISQSNAWHKNILTYEENWVF